MKMTVQIGELFDAVEILEKRVLQYDEIYILSNTISIKDKNNNYKKVISLIKKKDNGRQLDFDTDDSIKCADNHNICFDTTNNFCIKAKDVPISKTFTKANGELSTVIAISTIVDTTFYDMQIDSDDHLYQTSNGFVHHNTYLVSSLYANYRKNQGLKKAIIFSSSIGVLNVKNELLKFTNIDEDEILSIGSMTKEKNRLLFNDKHNIIIMSYNSLKYIQDAYYKANNKKLVKFTKNQIPLEDWLDGTEGMLFLDEAHLLGNPSSRLSECVNMILPYFDIRYLFSATPWDELHKAYLQLKILDKDLVRGLSYNSWLEIYFSIGTKWSMYAPDLKSKNIEKEAILNNTLQRYYMTEKRKKESILDIPVQYNVPTIYLDMSDAHRSIYEDFSNFVFEDIKERDGKNDNGLINNLLSSFQFLMLAVENPARLLSTESFNKFTPALQKKIKDFKYEKDFNKLNALDAIIEEECNEYNHKVLVFYQHPLTCEFLEKHLKEYKPMKITAETKTEDRFNIIEDFKKNNSKILIGSINIMNTSISITEAKAIIYVERCWHYPTYEQSTGRISRPGQTETTKIYTMLYKNSVDTLQDKNLLQKGEAVSSIAKRTNLNANEWKLVFNGNF